ncbi:uncharacterized protein DNG_00138 [Cephalotrichum gorgonifer]|uniref:gamma-glutamylcyclotransferase n=1 Tax=Cephalotrichum gorgonifer TaxID=2041049 RepID=A0AAE8SQH4_9PEZI|nr:uncharacterized protein DNG_00138 [Cephalotrichum gorgonifer]
MEEIKEEAEATLLSTPSLPSTETRLRRTSISRLEQSPADGPPPQTEPDTVLYLAYGSNLCAKTFLGTRGIRPLSQVNVTAPSLRLTFSIPGLPYTEPCFANTAPREIPKEPIQDPRQPLLPPPVEEPVDGEPTWDKGLVGVVYEVTKGDYQKIIATEGGGTSYKEIIVPCIIIPPRMSVPENPGGGVPRPFLARTLCMPFIPSKGDEGGEGQDDNEKGGKRLWWWLAKGHQRPREDYAQASERYLNLLRTGAEEHELPDEYQAYLAALQPYTITTKRQMAGKVLMLLMWGPAMLTLVMLGNVLADKEGKMPAWLAVVMSVFFKCLWGSYDLVAKRLFGDGERTITDEEGKEDTWWCRKKTRGEIRLDD